MAPKMTVITVVPILPDDTTNINPPVEDIIDLVETLMTPVMRKMSFLVDPTAVLHLGTPPTSLHRP
jgi:hypothetical protein